MNRLKEKLKQKGILNIFCTAGYPKLHDLPTILLALEEAGADMVEIGIPYSDPIADGPVIQDSNKIALANGITIDLIFDQLTESQTTIPKILMGYFNPVLQYGIERFCSRCKSSGVDAVILPDLPIDVYVKQYKTVFERYDVSNVFLISPQTSTERIAKIDSLSSTFIYAVSSASTTGNSQKINSSSAYLSSLKSLPVSHPILVGFNISEPADLALVHAHAQGGIIGSAFIKYIKEKDDVALASKSFVEFITSNTTLK